ncbi:MAG TPA: transcriptional regulator, partial [Burkholderiales bacterium]|nr:transcriptional regulator [Burkholderiales bacterium]
MEIDGPDHAGRERSLTVRLFGPVTVLRNGIAVQLPASRKVRALFAYLTLAPSPVRRTQLCDLLWDIPDDPRGELRWSLSKLRGVIDEPGKQRVYSNADAIGLNLADCFVDALEIAGAAEQGIGTLSSGRQRMLSRLVCGDFLEGIEIDRNPLFNGWLIAQRRRFRGCHVALLEQLARNAGDEAAFEYLEQWLQLAPFDPHAHQLLLTALARHGRIEEGETHLKATVRQFEEEGLDGSAIRAAWRSARAQATSLHATFETVPAGSEIHERQMPVAASRRASIAVMPFADQSADTTVRGGAADALAHDVITRLAQLRSLFVIAQGTVFALHDRRIGAEEAGRMLNVDYVVSGSVRRRGKQLTVSVELAQTRSARIVWAQLFNYEPTDAFVVLDEIGNRIVASIASEIE